MAKPWMTSNDIIAAIKRKTFVPLSQNTFSESDLLDFTNEEVMASQVPSVLQFHEEYFVQSQEFPIKPYQRRYAVPDRAIGMRLRDVFFKDYQNNYVEMTRVSPEDKAFWENSYGDRTSFVKYYLEGNDIVLIPDVSGNPTGSLVFTFFIRPNQLVKDERAAIIKYFTENVVVDNAQLIANDTITINDIVFTAVSGAPTGNQFQIGGTSILTATNLVNAINSNGVAVASNGSPSTATVTIKFTSLSDSDTIEISNDLGLVQASTKGIEFESIPSNITNSSIIDFLQTKPGHKIRAYDIQLASNAISANTCQFTRTVIPYDLAVGDYMCLQNECIIPNIPPDLHINLVERTCGRILAAMGDQSGLAASNAKIQEIEQRQGTLLDSRVEGSPQKITNKSSLLRFLKAGWNRRL